MSDGSFLHVTEHELPAITAPAPRQRRQPNPKRPVQDDSVIEVGPAHQRETNAPQPTRKKQRARGKVSWVLIFGIGMLAMLALWVALQAFGAWWQRHQDDATYGYPRTYQVDAVAGHNGDSTKNPSHFLFLNLNGHIFVIELPAGDGSKAKIYYGPTLYTDDANLIPVTGELKDVNGDGKPDLILHIQDQRIVFMNDNGQFRPAKPTDHITL
jgi:hypothetical protein